MPDANAAIPRIFVSHSHTDNAYCHDFVAALRRALGSDDSVWYDEHNLGWGKIRRTIEHELERRQHFIAILSPAAVESQWVNDEIDAARGLLHEGKMHTVSFVTAEKCAAPLPLHGYQRIELINGEGYPPAEAAAHVLPIIAPESVQAPVVAHPQPPQVLPRDQFPERLERLGFVADAARNPQTGQEVTYILPPVRWVEAGPFRMGSDKRQDLQAYDNELPQHEVTRPAYEIGTFPVTVAEYACFVASGHPAPRQGYFGTDWQTQLQRPDHPVTCVTWHDATAYTAWLARVSGQPWKLPTEAEWEKAARWDARARLARLYPWADRFDAARCNTQESERGASTPVGTYGPETPDADGSSPCGAQDMAGNVWEWTSSLIRPYRYDPNDGRENPYSADNRALRGGSWASDAERARAAYRGNSVPDLYNGIFGFRLARMAAAG